MKHDIALSFAGEDRTYVEMVADQLIARDVSVFYDRFEQANLWGKDLYEHLTEVYRNEARYTVMFISTHYADKLWTNHERRAAQARDFEQSREYILPARFDDTEIAGVLPTMGFIDLRTTSPLEVALLLCEKLGRSLYETNADKVPTPKNPALVGEASFDYWSHNGRFRIGEGHLEFETRWSKASEISIHCYIDSSNVRGIALAPKGATIRDVVSTKTLDFTSRCRTLEIGRIAALQNVGGVFCGCLCYGDC